jgi:KUP system potassium uptake protein
MPGGTFALYSLLCRHAKINTIPNQHRTDEELTTYSRYTYDEKSLAAKIKRWLEGHQIRKNVILILVLFGTCMAVGDGILTPAISGEYLYVIFMKNLYVLLCIYYQIY